MTDRLVIRLQAIELNADTLVDWHLFNEQGEQLAAAQQSVNTVAEQLQEHSDSYSIHIVVPAQSLLLVAVTIPSTKAQQIKLALPYVVEELIADDIENVHIALAPSKDLSLKQVDVGVVAHTTLINWLDTLHSQQLSPQTIISEIHCLPMHVDSWTLLVDAQRVLIRCGNYGGLVAATGDIELIIKMLLQQDDHEIATRPSASEFMVLASKQSTEDQALAAKLCAFLREHYSDYPVKEGCYQPSVSTILCTAAAVENPVAINLLQGGYEVRGQGASNGQRWHLAAMVAGFGLVLYLLLTLSSGWYFNQQAESIERQQVALYRQMFPGERRVISPKKQLKNHLRLTGNAVNTSFLSLLANTAKPLVGNGQQLTLAVKQLRFNSNVGDLQFEISSQSLDQLEQLKQLLVEAGMSVDINSATEQDNIVLGRIVVRSL